MGLCKTRLLRRMFSYARRPKPSLAFPARLWYDSRVTQKEVDTMNEKKIHILSLLAALRSAVIFGMSFMFSKLALEKAAPTVLLAVRFTVAVAAMTLVILVNALVGKLRGRPLFTFSLRGKPVYQLLLLGIVQPVAYFIFENYGILYTSSAVAGTIIAAVPVCCILMDVLVLHEKVTLKQVL